MKTKPLQILNCVGQKWWWVSSPETQFTQKTPEMNELETDKKILKI